MIELHETCLVEENKEKIIKMTFHSGNSVLFCCMKGILSMQWFLYVSITYLQWEPGHFAGQSWHTWRWNGHPQIRMHYIAIGCQK